MPAHGGGAVQGLLVGRDREVAALDALLAYAREHRGRGVVVLGEPGIGKTTLVETFAAHAGERGFLLAVGRCSEADVPAYWPWRQALRAVRPALDARLGAGDTASRAELFASVVDELSTLAGRSPAVLILEDVHWADAPSLALVRFVADVLPALPLVFVLTARDDPLETPMQTASVLGSLPGHVERLWLDGLDEPAIGELVRRLLGYPPAAHVVARIADRSGGNPFFVREVTQLQALRGGDGPLIVPPGVQQLLSRRLARLSQPCHDLLAVAAVAGGDLKAELLSEVVGEAPDAVLSRLDEAVVARLVTADELGLRFAHALVREVLYAGQSPATRAQLHRRVAQALERRAQRMPPAARRTVLGELAAHWRQAAGSDARRHAADRALLAARDAMARMGYEQAVGFYRWALEDAPADELSMVLELGEAQVLAGELTAGRATLLAAAGMARDARLPRQLGRALLGIGTGIGGFEVPLYDEQQVLLLEEALDGLGDDDVALRAALLARLSVAASNLRPISERVAMAREATGLARDAADARAEVAALAAWCDAEAGPRFVEQRLTRSLEMIAAAERSQDAAAVLLARRFRVVALAERGHFPAFDEEVKAYARTAGRLRLPLYTWPVPIWKGMRALMSGDLTTARGCLDEAQELADRAASENAGFMVFTLASWLHRAAGELDALLPMLERVVAPHSGHPTFDAGLAGFNAAAGKLDVAARFLGRRIAAGLDTLPADSEQVCSLWLLGEAAIATEDVRACEQILEHLRPYAHLWAVDGMAGATLGAVTLQLGRLSTALGRFDEAEGWIEDARARHREVGAALLVAEADAALARLPRRGPVAVPAPVEGAAAFLRAGRLWAVSFRGTEATVPDSKGMRDLAVLIAHPHREVHVLDLVEAAGGPTARTAGGHTGEQLDATARTAYRERLADLEEDLAEAEGNADSGRVARLRDEQRFITEELARALGLSGRARTTGDPVERARKAVAMRIRTAVKAIGEVHPDLARHLGNSVSTGRFCAYRPETAITWRL